MDRIGRARERLERARASFAGPVTGMPSDWRASGEELLAAERELAALTGGQYAAALSLDVEWDVGAPMPFVIADARHVAVVVYPHRPDAAWTAMPVSVANPSGGRPEPLGLIEFDGVYDVRFGGLNDEALDGHPLSGRGLSAYEAHTVVDSEWIAESERRNSVHSAHRGGWADRLTHYILCFHDQLLECLAETIRTTRHMAPYPDLVLATTAAHLRGARSEPC